MTMSKLIKFGTAVMVTAILPQAALANCNGDRACLAWRAANSQNVSVNAFSSASQVTKNTISNVRIPGLAPDERLCPVKCPVNVYNPENGQVKDCYNICKEVKPVPRVVYKKPIAPPRLIRVIHPVIYIPPAPCQTRCRRSRYGN